MWRSSLGLMTLLACAQAAGPAVAQNAQPAPVARWETNTVPEPQAVPIPVGYAVAPGVTFIPQAFTEIGYDNNPNQTFYDQKGSGFIRSGAGFLATYASPTVAANLAASGSMLDYFNDTIFDDPLRFSGGAKASVTYLLQPGLTLSTTDYVAYDGQSYNKTQTAGTSIDLGYRDELVSSVLHGRFSEIDYLNDLSSGVAISPVFLTSAFNHNRSDVTWTTLVGNTSRLAPYAEVSAARVDYTDQPDSALVDRSADDYHVKGGVRVIISPELSSDLGWRVNWRDTDDQRITSYSSNFFDGSLTWQPAPFFFFNGSIERIIGEPSTVFAVLADIRSYTVKGTYLPIPGVSMTAGGGWQVVSDIGSGVHYNSNFADAQVAWDYNAHVQFYTTLHYQTYEIKWQDLEYDCLRVMAGIRIIPDGQDVLEGESLQSLFARLKDSHGPSNAELSVAAGYSWFGLPDMKMVSLVGGLLTDQALDQLKNGEGSLNGWRTDMRLSNFAESALPNGNLLSFGLSGFFANYQGTTNSHCMYTLTTDCIIVNIVDSNPAAQNNTGWLGDLHVATDRDVNYYGVAVDARLGSWGAAGLKDSPPVQELSPIKLGVAFRGLDETAKLTSTDPYVSIPLEYKESLNTRYYGAFAGFEQKQPVGWGWIAGLDATAGIYYTNTGYEGRYHGYTIGSASFVEDPGIVNESLERGSFIGTLRVAFSRDLGWGTAGFYGQGEYLSYVPHVVYNNNDLAGIAPWGVIGTQYGTHVRSDDAFNYTTGLSLSVPTN